MESEHSPEQNNLLAPLKSKDKERVFPNLELVHMCLGENI